MTTAALASLADIRAEIDALDDTLLDLIARRVALAARACAAKGDGPLFRPAREHAVLAHAAAGPIDPALGRAVWRQLIAGALMTEGIAEIVVADEALRLPAIARFGQVIPVRVAPDAALHAARPDALVIVRTVPPGCAALDPIHDDAGAVVAHVVGPAGDRA